VGVQIVDAVELDLPLEVKFKSHLFHKGGPSHGAMLALTLMNQLIPGGVTRGNHVAGTGTIDIYGNIGSIGGIAQKALLIERAGADVFFVPAAQLEEARKDTKDLNIVPVNTIDDMLQWLQNHPKG
jgi:PDZ domain-containing protein